MYSTQLSFSHFFNFKKRPKNIILLVPDDNILFNNIASGIIAGLDRNEKLKYTFSVVIGCGDQNGMKRVVRETIAARSFDLFLTVGQSSTELAFEITKKHCIQTPIVFTAVENAQRFGFIKSYEVPGNNLTGFEGSPRTYEDQMNILFGLLQKRIKNILVPYTSITRSFVPGSIFNAITWLQEKRFNVISVVLNGKENIIEKIAAHMRDIDLVFMPRDAALVNYIDELVALCNMFAKPLYASDLVSVERGASSGFGSEEFKDGVGVANKACKILLQNEQASRLPVEAMPWNPDLVINLPASQKQNLKFNFEKAKLLPQVKFIQEKIEYSSLACSPAIKNCSHIIVVHDNVKKCPCKSGKRLAFVKHCSVGLRYKNCMLKSFINRVFLGSKSKIGLYNLTNEKQKIDIHLPREE